MITGSPRHFGYDVIKYAECSHLEYVSLIAEFKDEALGDWFPDGSQKQMLLVWDSLQISGQ